MLSRMTFYRRMLLSPLLVPLLFYFLPSRDYPDWVEFLHDFLVFSLQWGAIPYALLALYLFWYSLGVDTARMKVKLLIAPLLMVPLEILYVLVVLLWDCPPGSRPSPEDLLYFLLYAGMYIAGFVLVLGNAYVMLGCLVEWLMDCGGLFRPES